jgi:hypothetical protein
MEREGHDGVKFFTGVEIENSPAKGKRTLFVVGTQPAEVIEQYLSNADTIEHIYFGANMSFPNPTLNDATQWAVWEEMIRPFLEKGYWCTLDVDSSAVEGLVEGGLCEYNNFIPMISVKLPYVQLLRYNATIKLDDKDFNATNPGVWCHSVHDLMARDKFTCWDEYEKDEPL